MDVEVDHWAAKLVVMSVHPTEQFQMFVLARHMGGALEHVIQNPATGRVLSWIDDMRQPGIEFPMIWSITVRRRSLVLGVVLCDELSTGSVPKYRL